MPFDILLSLLRAALWQTTPQLPHHLSPTEWQEVKEEAGKQTVTALAFDAVQRLPDEQMPDDDILMTWAAEADTLERTAEEMTLKTKGLIKSFRNAGLHPLLLKGQTIAQIYPNPYLREPGDIDIYFHGAEQGKAVEILQRNGFLLARHADNSISYQWNGVEVEHHTHVFDIHNPRKQRLLQQLTEEVMGVISANNTGCPQLPPHLNILMQEAHILKHAMGRGIGLRQFCDLALSLNHYHDTIDASVMEKLIADTGMARWDSLVRYAIKEWLMPPTMVSDSHRTPSASQRRNLQRLRNAIISGGNFGKAEINASTNGKIATAMAFVRHSMFSLSVAPAEAISTFLSLTKGQKRSNKTTKTL